MISVVIMGKSDACVGREIDTWRQIGPCRIREFKIVSSCSVNMCQI